MSDPAKCALEDGPRMRSFCVLHGHDMARREGATDCEDCGVASLKRQVAELSKKPKPPEPTDVLGALSYLLSQAGLGEAPYHVGRSAFFRPIWRTTRELPTRCCRVARRRRARGARREVSLHRERVLAVWRGDHD